MNTNIQHVAAFCAWALVSGLSSAHAAAPVADPFPSRSASNVACLQAAAPRALALSKLVEGPVRLLRARLIFRPDAPEPRVEWLWSGDAEAAKQLEPSLHAYRMPCLAGQQGEQAVVQEFWLSPDTGRLEAGDAWPVSSPASSQSQKSCYREPDLTRQLTRKVPTGTAAAVFGFRFVEGSEVPEVQVIRTLGPRGLANVVQGVVETFRRCPEDPAPSEWHLSSVRISEVTGEASASLPFELPAFLGMTKDAANLRGHFDTSTMQCPFKVQFWVGQPALPNSASSIGTSDPNRAAFLGWLGRLQFDLPRDTETALMGSTLTINVPCLDLNLQGRT